MSVGTVSTYGSLQTLLQQVSQVQNDLNNDQVQISSGYVSPTFDGLNGSVEQFTALNSQISSLTNFQAGNASTISQLNTSASVLGQIQQIATSIKGLLVSQQSGTASSSSFTQQLTAYQDSLVSQLNTTYGGNYIFSGTASNTQPIKSPLPTLSSTGALSADYYQGNTEPTTLQISQTQTVSTNINGASTPFQQLFAGISQALQSGGTDTSALSSAENLISNGIQGTIAMQATVNANVVTIQQVDTESQSIQTYYQGVSDSMSQSDVVAISTKVAQDQSVLEASFETFARISSLSLANYLK